MRFAWHTPRAALVRRPRPEDHVAPLAAALAAVLVGLAFAAPGPAPAQSPSDPLGGLVSTVSDTACTVGTTADEALEPLVGVFGRPPSPGLLASVLCQAGLVDLSFHTVYRDPSGHEVVRDTRAVPAAPTPIDMTGDGIPDALGTVTLTSINQISMKVDKLATAPASLPVQVELVTHNPGSTDSRSRIAVGYDARDENMPSSFTADVSLLGFDPLHLGVSIRQQNAPPRLALIAEMFDVASDGSREPDFRGRLGFEPVPESMSYDLLLGADHQHITVTSAVLTKVTAAVALIDGDREQTIDGTIDKLPTQADVDILTTDATHRAVTYQASSPIEDIDFAYRDVTHAATGDTLGTEILAHAVDLPTGLTFRQTGALAGVLTTQGGPIGLVEGGFATGEHVVPVPGDDSGASVRTGGGRLSIAARLRGVQAATMDFSDPYAVDLQAAKQPVHLAFRDSDAGLDVAAEVHDLPPHIALALDPRHGKISENGFGDEIDSVTADVESASALFSSPLTGNPVKRIRAELTGIPASFNLAFGTAADGTFSASMDNPVEQIDLRADDGTHEVPLAADSGITYHDVPDTLAIAGRVFGLRRVSFKPAPFEASAESAGGHLFELDGHVKLPANALGGATVKATGVVEQLPSSLAVDVNPTPGGAAVLYTASSSIDRLFLDAETSKPIFTSPLGDNPVTHMRADLRGIPDEFELAFDAAPDGTFSASMDNPVDQVELQADDGTHTVALPPDAGVTYHDVPGTLAVAARIFGLKRVSFQPAPFTANAESAPGHVFALDGRVKLPESALDGATVTAKGAIDRLPSSLSVDVASRTGGADVTYTASSPIDALSIEATTDKPIFSSPLTGNPVKQMEARLVGIPEAFVLGFGTGSDGSFSASMDNPVDQIDLRAGDGTHSVPLPEDSGVTYHDVPNELALAARIFGLKRVSFQPSPFKAGVESAGGHVFALDGRVKLPGEIDLLGGATVSATGSIDKLPSSVDVAVAPRASGADINYTASAAIDELSLDATASKPIFSSPLTDNSVKRMHARLTRIPGNFKLAFGTAADGSFSASMDNPVHEIDLRADDGTNSVPLPEDSGVTYHDVPGNLALAAKIFGLKSVGFHPSPFKASVESAAGHVFALDGLVKLPASVLGGATVTAKGAIDRLPSKLTVDVAPRAGGADVNYTATSAIDALSIEATTDKPIFSSPLTGNPMKRMKARLLQIPGNFKLAFGTGSDGSFSTSMDNPVGEIQLQADDGAHSVPLPSDSGVTYHDIPGTLAAAARVYGLRSISFTPRPFRANVETAGGHVFALDGHVKLPASIEVLGGATVRATGAIDKLPSSVGVDVVPTSTGTKIAYTASSAITALSLEATTDKPIFSSPLTGTGVKRMKAKLLTLPTAFTLNVATGSDGAFSASMDNPVSEIQLQADDGTNTVPLPTDSGITYHDLPGNLAAAVRVFGLKSVRYAPGSKSGSTPAPLTFSAETAGGHVFALDGDVSLPPGDICPAVAPNRCRLTATGSIDKLPSTLSVTESTTATAGTTIKYDAFSPIDAIELRAKSAEMNLLPGLSGQVHQLYARVRGIPAKLDVTVPPKDTDNPIFTYDAHGATIQSIEFQALDGADRSLVTTVGPDANGVYFRDLKGATDASKNEVTLAAALSGLRGSASVQIEPKITGNLDIDAAHAKPFSIDVKVGDPTNVTLTSPTFVRGSVDKLAPHMQFDIVTRNETQNPPPPCDPGSTARPDKTVTLLTYSADNAIDKIELNTNAAGKCAPLIELTLRNLPTKLRICQSSYAGHFSPCVRPKPAGYTSEEGHAGSTNVQAALDIDDFGMSSDARPITISANVCLIPDPGDDCSRDIPQNHNGGMFIDVRNFEVHNLMLDASLQVGCDGGGLFCGHLGFDTRDRSVKGQIGVTAKDRTFALVTLPAGMRANYRYTAWNGQPIPPFDITRSLFHEHGTITCPTGTTLGWFFPFGTSFLGVDIADDPGDNITSPSYLCHDSPG